MADKQQLQSALGTDYPIEIRDEDWSLSLQGDVLLTGEPAEKVRRWLVNYPQHYPRIVVPYIRKQEPSFKPGEVWIDAHGGVHITNKRVARRMLTYLQKRQRRRSPQG